MLSWKTAHELMLTMPHAEERDHFGAPSFRVRGKIFAQLSRPNSDNERALVKLSPSDQDALMRSAPETFSAAPHWGRHGWTYVQLATVSKSALHELVLKSWRSVAPTNLKK